MCRLASGRAAGVADVFTTVLALVCLCIILVHRAPPAAVPPGAHRWLQFELAVAGLPRRAAACHIPLPCCLCPLHDGDIILACVCSPPAVSHPCGSPPSTRVSVPLPAGACGRRCGTRREADRTMVCLPGCCGTGVRLDSHLPSVCLLFHPTVVHGVHASPRHHSLLLLQSGKGEQVIYCCNPASGEENPLIPFAEHGGPVC